ncbi:MAG: hypothetical protein J6J79_11825 [Lachnospiraceae bacterium]|nr:hypothetical protein [Lachnospiraceae bacterium]
MESNDFMKKRFLELANKAYNHNIYTFTGFLGLSEMADFYEIEREVSFIKWEISGGHQDSERVMIRFGSAEQFGYEEPFPIVCLKIRPLMQKFADKLSHRDFLGALMNLGIERDTLGDIVLKENQGYLLCTETIAPYICENLTRIKHTSVICEITRELPIETEEDAQEVKLQVSSIRIDGVMAKVYHFSRGESVEYFRQKKVFVNGRLCENNSYSLKENDVVTVRGYGKFVFDQNLGLSKKGKLNIAVKCYGKK